MNTPTPRPIQSLIKLDATLGILKNNLQYMESTLIHMLDSGTISQEVATQLQEINQPSLGLVEKYTQDSN